MHTEYGHFFFFFLAARHLFIYGNMYSEVDQEEKNLHNTTINYLPICFDQYNNTYISNAKTQ